MKKIYTLLASAAMMFGFNANAQYCTPPSFLSGPFTGILNVNFAGIDNTTAGTDGYSDYTTGTVGAVTQGQSYPISIEVEHTLLNGSSQT